MTIYAFIPGRFEDKLSEDGRGEMMPKGCNFIIDNTNITITDNSAQYPFQQSFKFHKIVEAFPDVIMDSPNNKNHRIISICSSYSVPTSAKIKETATQLLRFFYPDGYNREVYVSCGYVNDKNVLDLLAFTQLKVRAFEAVPTYCLAEAVDLLDIALHGMKKPRDSVFVFRVSTAQAFLEWVILPNVDSYVETTTSVNLSPSHKVVFTLKKLNTLTPNTFEQARKSTSAFKLIADSFYDVSTFWVGHLSDDAMLISNISIVNIFKHILRGCNAGSSIGRSNMFVTMDYTNYYKDHPEEEEEPDEWQLKRSKSDSQRRDESGRRKRRVRKHKEGSHGRNAGDRKGEGVGDLEYEYEYYDYGSDYDDEREITLAELDDLSFMVSRDKDAFKRLANSDAVRRASDQGLLDESPPAMEEEDSVEEEDVFVDPKLTEEEKRVLLEARQKRREAKRMKREEIKAKREARQRDKLEEEERRRRQEEEEEVEQNQLFNSIRGEQRIKRLSRSISKKSTASHRSRTRSVTDLASSYSRVSRRNRLAQKLQQIRDNNAVPEEEEEDYDVYEEDDDTDSKTRRYKKPPPTQQQQRQQRYEKQKLLAHRCLKAAKDPATSAQTLKELDEELQEELKISNEFRQSLTPMIIALRKEITEKKAIAAETSNSIEEFKILIGMAHNIRVQSKYKSNHPKKFPVSVERHPEYSLTIKLLEMDIERVKKEIEVLRLRAKNQ